MLKSLLSEHFVLSMAALLIVGIGWLVGRVGTETALPIVVMLAGVNVGISAFARGVNQGVPLTASGKSEVVNG